MSHDRRLALVTGASSGIGQALAGRLARDGHDLIVVARRRDRLTALAERLTSETGAEVEVLVADLTAPDDVQRLEERVAGEPRLHLLVNNAGFAGYGPFVEIDPPVAERLVAVHVLAPVRITRAALPGMIARGHGAVVNVASLLALSGPLKIGMAARATYAGAKSFLLAFTQSLAGELEGTGVHAMVCLPGMVESEFHGDPPRQRPGLAGHELGRRRAGDRGGPRAGRGRLRAGGRRPGLVRPATGPAAGDPGERQQNGELAARYRQA